MLWTWGEIEGVVDGDDQLSEKEDRSEDMSRLSLSSDYVKPLIIGVRNRCI